MKTENLNRKANLYILIYFVVALLLASLVSCKPSRSCPAYAGHGKESKALHPQTFLRDEARK